MNVGKIDKLQKKLVKLKKDLFYWEVEFQPSGNMGRWGRKVRLDQLRSDIKKVEVQIINEVRTENED